MSTMKTKEFCFSSPILFHKRLIISHSSSYSLCLIHMKAFLSTLPMCRQKTSQVVLPPNYIPQVFASPQPSLKPSSQNHLPRLLLHLLHGFYHSANALYIQQPESLFVLVFIGDFFFVNACWHFQSICLSSAQSGMYKVKRRLRKLIAALFLRS